jgi:FkbM family methyltransferase
MKPTPMIVNTRRLFAQLLRSLRISDVCDVGSMNGEDAVAFSLAAPQARVYAFEPNPGNYRLMEANRTLQQRNIQVMPLAVTNHDGEAEFFLVEAEYSRRDPRRGMSSLHQRSGECAPASVVRVRTTRLDTFLADKCQPGGRLALWIDTEGSAYEVIEGLGGVARQVQLLHVEVETSPCIGSNQKLYPEVKALLRRLGFAELATDQPASHIQFNALFIRVGLPAGLGLRVRAWLLYVWLRRLAVSLLARWCPACLRRYQAMRLPSGW